MNRMTARHTQDNAILKCYSHTMFCQSPSLEYPLFASGLDNAYIEVPRLR